MGMDVYGTNPSNESGQYFRANVWYWRPLWNMIENLYPDIADMVPNAHYNDGDGLDDIHSLLLASLLKHHIDSGFIEEYIKEYTDTINSIPDEDCTYCNQTGYRIWPQQDGSATQKECNVCSGTLKTPSFSKNYPMDINLIKEFQVFLENCGGFQIH